MYMYICVYIYIYIFIYLYIYIYVYIYVNRTTCAQVHELPQHKAIVVINGRAF